MQTALRADEAPALIRKKTNPTTSRCFRNLHRHLQRSRNWFSKISRTMVERWTSPVNCNISGMSNWDKPLRRAKLSASIPDLARGRERDSARDSGAECADTGKDPMWAMEACWSCVQLVCVIPAPCEKNLEGCRAGDGPDQRSEQISVSSQDIMLASWPQDAYVPFYL